MVDVHDVNVLVPEGRVPVRMAMRLPCVPALMCVPVVRVMGMQVLVLERLVQVLHLAGVMRRP